jgi:hypothetical protein
MIIKNIIMGENLEAELSHDFLSIFKLNYHGEFHRSENGRFILSWSDADEEGLQGGARDSGNGRYILIDGDKIILQGELERPNDGKVSNQGFFVINDWMFKGDLTGTFYAFDISGKKLIRYKVSANLGKSGISNDGRYAVCQTYDSKTEDGNKIFLFDLIKQELVWKWEPKTGWADNYCFDVDNKILSLVGETGKSYRYSFDGNFLDSEKWEEERLESANGYELLNIAVEKRRHLESINANLAVNDEVIPLLKKALDMGVSEYCQATIHRELGEAYQKLGMITEAIKNFEKAISLNPKIGVTKRLKSLKEALPKG